MPRPVSQAELAAGRQDLDKIYSALEADESTSAAAKEPITAEEPVPAVSPVAATATVAAHADRHPPLSAPIFGLGKSSEPSSTNQWQQQKQRKPPRQRQQQQQQQQLQADAEVRKVIAKLRADMADHTKQHNNPPRTSLRHQAAELKQEVRSLQRVAGALPGSLTLTLPKDKEQQLLPLLEVQQQVATEEEVVRFKAQMQTVAQHPAVALGSIEPKVFRSYEQRRDSSSDSSSSISVKVVTQDFVVTDGSELGGLIDAQTGRLQVHGSDVRLKVHYDSLPVRSFELAGISGMEPTVVANMLQQRGIRVLSIQYAKDGSMDAKNVVRFAAACTGLAPSSVSLTTSSKVCNLLMRELPPQVADPDSSLCLRRFRQMLQEDQQLQELQQQQLLQSQQQQLRSRPRQEQEELMANSSPERHRKAPNPPTQQDGLCGGSGIVPDGNIGSDVAVFEQGARHVMKSIAGKGIANPTTLLLTTSMMLRHLQLHSFSDRLESAVVDVYMSDDKSVLTPDVGGSGNTQTFTDAVCERL